jgi:hypothetical protein
MYLKVKYCELNKEIANGACNSSKLPRGQNLQKYPFKHFKQ